MNIRSQSYIATILLAILGAAQLGYAQDPALKLNPETPEARDIAIDAEFPVEISPDTGNVLLFTLPRDACSASDTTSCEDLIDLEIQNFQIDGVSGNVTVIQGTDVELEYRSRGSWECDRTGLPDTSWNRSAALPDTVLTVDTSSLEFDVTFDVRLECRNGPKSLAMVRQLTIDEPNSPPPETTEACIEAEKIPPGNWSKQTQYLVDGSRNLVEASKWADLFLSDFPGGGFEARLVNRPRQYMVVEFNTGDFTDPIGRSVTQGAFDTQPPDGGFPSGVESGTALATISACPGDFTVQEDPGCRATVGDLRWKKDDGLSTNSRCNLAENTRYFLNLAFVQDASASEPVWECNGGTDDDCGLILTNRAGN